MSLLERLGFVNDPDRDLSYCYSMLNTEMRVGVIDYTSTCVVASGSELGLWVTQERHNRGLTILTVGFAVLYALQSAIMGADLNQIQQKLDLLTARTTQIAQKAQQVYQGYLNILGRSVSQQLVMAAYHLCTQIEPQAFLSLTLTQQQTLQQELQKQGHQLQQSLQSVLQILSSPEQSLETDPKQLLQALQRMDEEIVTVLRDLSRQANHLLQDHNILVIKSMDALFEIAAKAENSGRSITSPPHLLKALVESKDNDGEASTPMMAIYLQVADLEFADPELMGWRHQIRQIIHQILAINKDYDQQLAEKMKSEAEAAWRASWFVENSDGYSIPPLD